MFVTHDLDYSIRLTIQNMQKEIEGLDETTDERRAAPARYADTVEALAYPAPLAVAPLPYDIGARSRWSFRCLTTFQAASLFVCVLGSSL